MGYGGEINCDRRSHASGIAIRALYSSTSHARPSATTWYESDDEYHIVVGFLLQVGLFILPHQAY